MLLISSTFSHTKNFNRLLISINKGSKGKYFPFFSQRTTQRPKSKFGSKLSFFLLYAAPSLLCIAHAIPLSWRVLCAHTRIDYFRAKV